ncbi:hypothetical protein GCM10010309_02500 [Streptomyces violaceochromogenes]|nr:hypothetical protein GCM10010309_02500 [Streptomyces violaceochromogenes]
MSTMDLPLVAGVDGSEPSLRAVDWAADEAALRGVPLRLVNASLWERYEGAAPASSPVTRSSTAGYSPKAEHRSATVLTADRPAHPEARPCERRPNRRA